MAKCNNLIHNKYMRSNFLLSDSTKQKAPVGAFVIII